LAIYVLRKGKKPVLWNQVTSDINTDPCYILYAGGEAEEGVTFSLGVGKSASDWSFISLSAESSQHFLMALNNNRKKNINKK